MIIKHVVRELTSRITQRVGQLQRVFSWTFTACGKREEQRGGRGGDTILPPATGNAGLAGSSPVSRELTSLALLAVAAGMVAAGRLLTRRRSP